MLKKLKDRYFILKIVLILGFLVLSFRLAYLTIHKGESYFAYSQERKVKELVLRGTRGNILDRNGIPLAMNKQIYAVQLDRQRIPSKDEELNALLERTIQIIENNDDGEHLFINIPIKRGGELFLEASQDNTIDLNIDYNKFYYIWEGQSESIQERKLEKWLKDAGIDKPLTAEQAVAYFRERYKISDDISDDMALKIASLRLDIYMTRYRQYEPIRVASGISSKTVAQIETFSSELPGVQVVVEAGRYYPMGDIAAHIVGYVGVITDKEIESYKALGYDLVEEGYDISSDKIGRTGVESYAEKWLTGNTKDKQGKLIAEVDSANRVIRVLDEELPQDGNDVVLTLDSRLQKATYDILAEEIKKMKEGLPPYDGENKVAPLAQNGAAVVLDVNTGEVLALVSYPSFNLNDFANGISTEKYKKLLEDPAHPLYALAFQGGMAPGSVFKMLIGVAGLEEGKISLNEKIVDRVKYDKYNKTNPPKCWSSSGHGSETIVEAIKHSCNYFFYEVADRLGIDAINEWAEKFGLKGPTGLEIIKPEWDYNIVANLDSKISAEYGNMWLSIKAILQKYGYFTGELSQDEKAHLNRLIDFELSEDRTFESGLQEVNRIADLLYEMGYLRDNKSDRNKAAQEIRAVLIDNKRWKKADTVIVGIGQSYTQISPLTIARYIAALVNGGKVLETHVVKGVVDEQGNLISETQPVVQRELEIKQEYIEAIREGMWKVVYDDSYNDGGPGSAVSYFAGLDPQITLGGKTGTAEIIPTNDLRNNAWFAAFTPYEKPEVAVVVAIPNGRTSGNAAPVARRIIETYYRLKEQNNANPVQHANELQP